MGLYVGFAPEDVGFPSELEAEGIVVVVDYSEACNAFVQTFLRVSKQIVPVDTGFLRSTLTAATDGDFCEAYTQCEYSQYVEYGTSRQRAQPYFEPAIEEAFEEYCSLAFIALDEAEAELEAELEALEEEEEENARSQSYSMPITSGGRVGFGAGLVGLLIVAVVIAAITVISAELRDTMGSRGASISAGAAPIAPMIEII